MSANENPIIMEPFESLSGLHLQHVEMMRAVRRESRETEWVERIRKFIDRVKATGTRLDSPADRDSAQNIITYWTSYLFTAGDREALSAAPAILDPFDPMNAPDLSKVASPYQGLKPFGVDDAKHFFGREEAIKILLNTLRDQPAVVVVGPMGSGKTSLVTAGVIPKLKSRMFAENRNPVFLVVIPRTDPFADLLRSIHEAAVDPALPKLGSWISEQKEKLERAPEDLRALLETVFTDRPVITIVDQFEQVFTLCTDPEARERFAKALISICPRAQVPNRTVIIVDERFQQQALQLAVLKPLVESPAARFYPPPPTAAEVQRIIESPATTVGLKFDEGIVEDLAREVAGDVKALPTLQFILNKLWNERARDRITWEAYRKVGRPREALIRTSDAVFGSFPPDEQNTARKVFLELVHPTVEGGIVRRRIRRDVLMQIDAPDRVTRVLQRYVEAGLIQLTPGTDRDGDRFDVIHEVLINNSPRLRDWLQREREQSEKKLQLMATARLWQESGFKSGYLISGDALDDAAAFTEGAPELQRTRSREQRECAASPTIL